MVGVYLDSKEIANMFSEVDVPLLSFPPPAVYIFRLLAALA